MAVPDQRSGIILGTLRGSVGASITAMMILGILLLSLITPVVSSDDPGLPPGDPAIGSTDFHQVIITQGDDPDTEDKEPRNLVVVTERTFWRVPWDSDVVYTYIPGQAENVFVDNVEAFEHQGQTFFIPGEYSLSSNPHSPPSFGREGDGVYQGMAYWSFPVGADRTSTNPVSFSEDEDWEDMDLNLTDRDDWLIVFNSLSLDENVTEATYTSKEYTGGQDIVSVNMTVTGEYKANMSFEVTWDNGTHWWPIVEGEPLPAEGQGSGFRWRVTMTQNGSLNINPIVDELSFDIRFIPDYTEIWLETTYHIRVPAQGSTEVFLKFPFDGNLSGMILVAYFDDDMLLEATGTTLTPRPDEDQAGRTTYYHMQGAFAKVVTLTMTDKREPAGGGGSPAWLWIAVPMVLVLLVAGVYMMRRESEGDHKRGAAVGGGDEDGAGGDDHPSERSELEGIKAEILQELSELDRQHEDGQLDEETYGERRSELKAEAIEVMRELESLE